jgi:adenylyltransferase/sulfurtransferase
METVNLGADALRNEIANTEKQLQDLKEKLREIEEQSKADDQPQDHVLDKASSQSDPPKWPLTQEEYARYGRQMIVSSIGITGVLCNIVQQQ